MSSLTHFIVQHAAAMSLGIPPIGRFAPSPSGPLHFGSLVAALASYLSTKSRQGVWYLRIEDIDPPREVPGASAQIIRCLEDHGLWWDGNILYQSHRLDAYREALDELQKQNLLYRCSCARKNLPRGIYPGICRINPPPSTLPAALRIKAEGDITFVDRVFGARHTSLPNTPGDFIVLRKDGLFAYNLAVVVDDNFQGITEVVRGHDLLSVTAQHVFLYHCLNLPVPEYAHIPLAVSPTGRKLSKEYSDKPLSESLPAHNNFRALQFLRMNPPEALLQAPVNEQLSWAIDNWDWKKIPAQESLPFTAIP